VHTHAETRAVLDEVDVPPDVGINKVRYGLERAVM
jgi:hypothetical protein